MAIIARFLIVVEMVAHDLRLSCRHELPGER